MGNARGARPFDPASRTRPTSVFPFIVGRGRSGTTLLRAILDSHPEMAIPGESHFIVTMASRRGDYERPEGFAIDAFAEDLRTYPTLELWGLTPAAVGEALADSLPRSFPEAVRTVFALYAETLGKPRYGEKTPINVVHMPLLAGLFPEARFVHIIRDGRDVALSYLAAGFGPSTIEEAAIYWRRFVAQGRRAGSKLGPDRYLEVRYEDLLDDTERVVRSVVGFVDLVFEPGMLRYFERGDEVARTAPHPESHRNLILPPTKGLRDWRRQMPAADVALFESLAGDLLSELGYEVASRPSIPTRYRAARGLLRVQRERALHGLSKRLKRLTKRGRRGAEAPVRPG